MTRQITYNFKNQTGPRVQVGNRKIKHIVKKTKHLNSLEKLIPPEGMETIYGKDPQAELANIPNILQEHL